MILQGLILNDEGEVEEDDQGKNLKKPKSAWSSSQIFVSKVYSNNKTKFIRLQHTLV